MSIFYDAARQYLAESYDCVLNDSFDSEYAALTPVQGARFDLFVDEQAHVLAERFRETCEAYMTDAPGLPEGVTEGLTR